MCRIIDLGNGVKVKEVNYTSGKMYFLLDRFGGKGIAYKKLEDVKNDLERIIKYCS